MSKDALYSSHCISVPFSCWQMAVLRSHTPSAATSLALALPGAEKSALAPLKPLFDLLAPLLEQANAPRSSKGHGAGLANLQIFPGGKRPGREPSRSPRSDVSEANDSQEQQPVQAAAAPAPLTMMVPASKKPDEPGKNDEEYEPEQDAKLFAKAKEDRKRKRLEEKTEAAQEQGDESNGKPKPSAKAKAGSKAKAEPKAKTQAKAKAASKKKANSTLAKAKAKAKASASKETEKEEDSRQEDEASAAKAETEKPVKANAAKKTRQGPRVFTGPERPPIMKDGDPTTHYLQGKVHRNSNLHCFFERFALELCFDMFYSTFKSFSIVVTSSSPRGGCKKFRVFLQAGDRQDKAVSYKNDESAAWATCCKLIEEHAKKLAAENVD